MPVLRIDVLIGTAGMIKSSNQAVRLHLFT